MRFVDPNPRLAQILNERLVGVLADETREWVTGWIADVGSILRSREFLAYSAATALSGTILGVVVG